MTDEKKENKDVEQMYFSHKQRAVIPGTENVEGTKFLYFSDNGTKSFKKTFKFLKLEVPPEIVAKDGSSIGQEMCHLFTPEGTLYHAASYTGDFEGMERTVAYCSHQAGLTLGWVREGNFVLEDGRSFPLESCKIEFYTRKENK